MCSTQRLHKNVADFQSPTTDKYACVIRGLRYIGIQHRVIIAVGSALVELHDAVHLLAHGASGQRWTYTTRYNTCRPAARYVTVTVLMNCL